MALPDFTHGQLVFLCGVILAVAGSWAVIWALQVINGVRQITYRQSKS